MFQPLHVDVDVGTRATRVDIQCALVLTPRARAVRLNELATLITSCDSSSAHVVSSFQHSPAHSSA